MLKPMFKKLMTSGRRCVVPIDGFYEFKTLDNKKKQPYYLYKSNAKSSSGGELPQLLLAGIYDKQLQSLVTRGQQQEQRKSQSRLACCGATARSA